MVCWDPTSAARPRDLDHWIWRGCSVLDGYPSVLMLPKKTTFLCHYHMFSVRAVHRYLKSAKGWLCCDVESSSFHMAPFLCATIWTHPHLCQHTAPVVEGTTVLYCIMWYSYVQILLWMVSESVGSQPRVAFGTWCLQHTSCHAMMYADWIVPSCLWLVAFGLLASIQKPDGWIWTTVFSFISMFVPQVNQKGIAF